MDIIRMNSITKEIKIKTTIIADGEHCNDECKYMYKCPIMGGDPPEYICNLFKTRSYDKKRCEECNEKFGILNNENN